MRPSFPRTQRVLPGTVESRPCPPRRRRPKGASSIKPHSEFGPVRVHRGETGDDLGVGGQRPGDLPRHGTEGLSVMAGLAAATSAMSGTRQAATYSALSRATRSATGGTSSMRSIPWPADHTVFQGRAEGGKWAYVRPDPVGTGRLSGSSPAKRIDSTIQLAATPATWAV